MPRQCVFMTSFSWKCHDKCLFSHHICPGFCRDKPTHGNRREGDATFHCSWDSWMHFLTSSRFHISPEMISSPSCCISFCFFSVDRGKHQSPYKVFRVEVLNFLTVLNAQTSQNFECIQPKEAFPPTRPSSKATTWELMRKLITHY